jgi:hypothetical protein
MELFLVILIAFILSIWLVNIIEWLVEKIRNYTYVEWLKESFNINYIKKLKYIISRLW